MVIYRSSLSYKGSFGRRASDGGANLHIIYPGGGAAGAAGQLQMENMYNSPADVGCQDVLNTVAMEGNDESNDEIKRYCIT